MSHKIFSILSSATCFVAMSFTASAQNAADSTTINGGQSVNLSDVVVKAYRPTTAIKGDALTTRVENTPLAHAGTANDVLRQIPMITGGDGNFEVFGKGVPAIYINDRRILDNIELTQLNSADIKSVEVITNPGARYDASVKSVVRIRTRRPKGDGWSGTISAQNGVAHYFQSMEQANLKFRSRGLELFANLGYYGDRSLNESTSSIITRSDAATWNQSVDESNRSTVTELFGKIGFDYMINARHSVGAYYQNGYNNTDRNVDVASLMMNDGTVFDNITDHQLSTMKRVPKHIANAYYNGSIGKLVIDFNADYMWTKERNSLLNDEHSDRFSNASIESQSTTRSRLFAEKLVLSYPLWKGRIELGEEYTNSRLSSSFASTASTLTDIATQSDENNIGIFVQLSQRLGRFNASVGLRYEHVNFSYLENGVAKPEQSRTFDNVFPLLSLSTVVRNVQLSLNYTNKTLRPSYSRLDGAVSYVNRFTYKSGNPHLLPTGIHSVGLMAAWRFLFAQLSYSHSTDPILNATRPYDTDPKVRLITYDNFSKSDALNIFVGTNLKYGIWQPKVNVGLNKQWLTVPYSDGTKDLNTPIPLVQWQNAIHLPGDVWLNVDMQWRGAGYMENCYLHSASYLNAKLYKAFLKNTLSVTLEARDIFNKNHECLDFYNGDVTIGTINRGDSRRFFVTVQYSFNATRDRYKGRGAGNAEKARF